MFFIPGQLIALVTLPGVIVHELAHQLLCRRYLPRHHRKILLARSFLWPWRRCRLANLSGRTLLIFCPVKALP